jgi:hypothetical protein
VEEEREIVAMMAELKETKCWTRTDEGRGEVINMELTSKLKKNEKMFKREYENMQRRRKKEDMKK